MEAAASLKRLRSGMDGAGCGRNGAIVEEAGATPDSWGT